MSPWAECPCWTWEAMIPSLSKVVQLKMCWKQKYRKEGEFYRGMSFILKGKTGLEKPKQFFLKHSLIVLQGYLLF